MIMGPWYCLLMSIKSKLSLEDTINSKYWVGFQLYLMIFFNTLSFLPINCYCHLKSWLDVWYHVLLRNTISSITCSGAWKYFKRALSVAFEERINKYFWKIRTVDTRIYFVWSSRKVSRTSELFNLGINCFNIFMTKGSGP